MDRFVETTGSDSNPGTILSPYQTLHKAIQSAVDGDRILMGGGIFAENSGSGYLAPNRAFANPITIMPREPSFTTIVRGASHASYNVLPALQAVGYRWKNIQFIARPGSTQAFSPNASGAGGRNEMDFEDCVFQADNAGSTYAFYVNFGTTIEQNIRMNLRRCALTQPSATGFGCINANTTAAGLSKTDLTFEDCVLNSAVKATVLNGPNLTINVLGGTWSATGTGGIALAMGVDGASGDGCRGVVRRALFSSEKSHCVLLGAGSTQIVFEDNKVMGGDHGVVIKNGVGHGLRRNEIIAGSSYGILLKGAKDNTITQNTIRAYNPNAACISNYDGDPTFKAANNRIFDNDLYAINARIMIWNILGDDGPSPMRNNRHNLSGTATHGDVFGVTGLASRDAFEAAFRGYGREKG